jgi:hypothetical protein
MKALTIGERVRVGSGDLSPGSVGRIVHIVEPFVAEPMKQTAFQELPLYSVRLEDGRSVRFRGRDLEPVD